MKILVFGATGMLGHKIVGELQKKFEVWATYRNGFNKYESLSFFDRDKSLSNVDAESLESIENAVNTVQPDILINAVGIIKQMPSSKNLIKTLNVNSIFPHRLAELARRGNSRLITISTDCVFDGKKGGYTEEDVSNAEDLYGKSKNLGEVIADNCLTLRTSIIGRELETEHSLVEWFLAQNGKKVRGFVNAIYSGFPTIVLSEIISDLIKNHPSLSGLYHVSSEPINKYDLLCLIRDEFGLDVEIERFEDFRIDRSLNSEKFRQATGFEPQSWKEMIRKLARDPFPYERVRAELKTRASL
jgi:dTDP-4-dehydrorhamnose reductase